MNTVALVPVVADLAATLDVEGGVFVLRAAQVERTRARLRAVHPEERMRVASHLLAWAQQLRAVGGAYARGPMTIAIQLAVDLCGDDVTARDLFGAAGLADELATFVGNHTVRRAPRVEASAAPRVRPTRGLSRAAS